MLVQKMLDMSSEINGDGVFFKDSLHSTYNRKKEREIDGSNQQLVRRLQNASSQYSQRGMAKSMKSYGKVKSNIAFSRMDPFYDLEMGKKASTQLLDQHAGASRRPYSAKR